MSKKIPVEIEVAGSQFKKSVGWTAVGVTAGAIIAGPVGGIIGLATQGNQQKFHCIIKFEDGTQEVIVCDGKRLEIEMIIWSWRINNKKTEKDYVDFGLDFSKLQRGMNIPEAKLRELLGADEKVVRGLGELWKSTQLYLTLRKFLKKEIERYFQENHNDFVILEDDNGFKIPEKFKMSDLIPRSPIIITGIVFALFLGALTVGVAFTGQQSPPSTTEQR